jgi:hypothetical protein
MRKITEGRRDVIYDALLALGKPSSTGEVLKMIEGAYLKQWPQATWLHARNDPYYVGLHQHLEAMSKRGDVAKVSPRPGYYDYEAVVPRPPRPPIPERKPKAQAQPRPQPFVRRRAPEAAALKEQGLKGPEIAKAMGISTSYCYLLLNDPSGERERARKARYCKKCGGKQDEPGRCQVCHDKRMHELLPPLHFVRYCDIGRRAGVEVVFGVTDNGKRVIRQGTRRGFTEYVLDERERWEEAVFHLGFVSR